MFARKKAAGEASDGLGMVSIRQSLESLLLIYMVVGCFLATCWVQRRQSGRRVGLFQGA